MHARRPPTQEERLGLRPRFEGNELTRWGNAMEPQGLAAYKHLTGRDVEFADLGVRPLLALLNGKLVMGR